MRDFEDASYTPAIRVASKDTPAMAATAERREAAVDTFPTPEPRAGHT